VNAERRLNNHESAFGRRKKYANTSQTHVASIAKWEARVRSMRSDQGRDGEDEYANPGGREGVWN